MRSGFFNEAQGFGVDEICLLVGSMVVCIYGAVQFCRSALVSKLGCPRYQRLPLYLAFIASFVFLLIAAKYWTAKEVRENSGYILLVMVMGGAFLALTSKCFGLLGMSVRDDVIERHNSAAVFALSGLLVSLMLIYTGSNLGEGPSFWENVFCSLVGAMVLFALWFIEDIGSGVVDSITVERDVAAGLRFACFMVSAGLIIGRALAGNWHSMHDTMNDFFHDGWPVLLLLLGGIPAELLSRPNAARPFCSWKIYGLPIGLLYLAFGIGWVIHLGLWEGARHP